MHVKGFEKGSPARFVLIFLSLFAIFFYFNIYFFGITLPGQHYIPFVANYLNYIGLLRYILLSTTAFVVKAFGFTVIHNDWQLLVAGKGSIKVVYSCLGLGVMSFFAAFVLAYPKKLKAKITFLLTGLVCIQVLNVLRFVLLSIFWDKKSGMILDHHTIFNIVIYILITVSLYFWVKHDDHKLLKSAKNRPVIL